MKTIIEMVREAGGYFAELPKGDAWLFDKEEQLEAFEALARADEREACAQLIESLFSPDDAVSEFIAEAIRARGQA